MRLIPRITRRRIGIALLTLLLPTLVIISLRLDWWERAPQRHTDPFRFDEDFETAQTLRDLFPADASRWTGLQREGSADNDAVRLDTDHPHTGRQSLRFIADKRTGNVVKSDIELGNLHFTRGDDVWFTGWYYLASTTDAAGVFLWDLEASHKWQSPGRRLYLQSGDALASDLGKWWGGKPFRQPKATAIPFPKDRWTRLKVHLTLHESDGLMEVWQDATQVINARGQTLPTSKTVYDRLQIGITANGSASAQTLYIDDIRLSNHPLD